jgi:hypothetical protein
MVMKASPVVIRGQHDVVALVVLLCRSSAAVLPVLPSTGGRRTTMASGKSNAAAQQL